MRLLMRWASMEVAQVNGTQCILRIAFLYQIYQNRSAKEIERERERVARVVRLRREGPCVNPVFFSLRGVLLGLNRSLLPS